MSTHRILRDNRRGRHRGPDLGTLVLSAAAWLLALVGVFGRREAKRKPPVRLSEVLDERYREWARGGGGRMRTLVLGDVHGAHRALVQVLERCGFDGKGDRVIFLGDVADGWPDTSACVNELLRIPNCVHLLGNHDEWFAEWATGGHPGDIWTSQGGTATMQSYKFSRMNVPPAHHDFLKRAKLWHQEGERIFVHGGWPWMDFYHPKDCATSEEIVWDRSLWRAALERHANGHIRPLTKFSEVYVGHTTTTRAGFTEPVQRCEVWNLDQGAGWEGKLSIMDADSKEFWQSDVVWSLYPEAAGRRRGA